MKDNLSKYGYVHIKNVLSKEEVIELRKLLDAKFNNKEKDARAIHAEEVLKEELLYLLPFKNKVIKRLKQSLGGDLCYFSDYQLMRNIAGNWHIDGGSELYKPYFMADDYRFVKCGIYLQSSNEGWGGSILIAPRGHKFFLKNLINNKLVRILIKNFVNKIQVKFFSKVINIEAGDMLFFDARLPHKSQWPNKENLKFIKVNENGTLTGIPTEHTKYAFYWNACNINNAEDFLINSKERAISIKTCSNNSKAFFVDYLKLCFPDDYPNSFVEHAKKNNVAIASLSRAESDVFKGISDLIESDEI